MTSKLEEAKAALIEAQQRLREAEEKLAALEGIEHQVDRVAKAQYSYDRSAGKVAELNRKDIEKDKGKIRCVHSFWGK